jgi:hypothetical protein
MKLLLKLSPAFSVRRIVIATVAVIVTLTVFRYSWAVGRAFGVDSELTYKPTMIRFVVSRAFERDQRAIFGLFGNLRRNPAEVSNENSGEMRVSVNLDELALSDSPIEWPSGAPFVELKGLSSEGALNVPPVASPTSDDAPAGAGPAPLEPHRIHQRDSRPALARGGRQ